MIAGEGDWKGSGAKPIVKPTKYDGTSDLVDYLNHFDLCVKVNGWDAAEAGMYLGLSLTGPARRLLAGRKPATSEGYGDLRSALVERFEPTNQEETYKAILRTRERKSGEGLQALQEDLTKYTRLSYPEADSKTTDTLVLDKFLLCLDPQLRQWVYQMQPKNLQSAVMIAVGAEAYLTSDAGGRQRARAADASVAEHLKASADRIQELTTAMADLTKKVDLGVQATGSKKKWTGGTACFSCGKEGHYKRECPLLAAKNGTEKPAGAANTTADQAAGN